MTERVRVDSGPFGHDGELFRDGDELEVSEDVLEHYPYSLEVIDETDETDDTEPTEEEAEPEVYTRDELEEMDYSELSQLAMESDDESINGRSSTGEIIDTLTEE